MPKKKSQQAPDNGDRDAYDIKSFCRRHNISPSFYFKLKLEGLAPKEMKIGRRVLITKEAAARWRAEREAAAAAS